MQTYRYASEYLLHKAERKMKRLGFVVALKSVYCGIIEVTWRKLK